MPERRAPGRSAVTRRAITDIVRAAVLSSYGVVGFASRRAVDPLIRWLRVDEPGIRIRMDERLSIALHLRVAYGLPVAEVARQVESAVRYSVERALGRPVDDLSIHVDGLDATPGGPPPADGDASGPSRRDEAADDAATHEEPTSTRPTASAHRAGHGKAPATIGDRR
jgi:uncharacterized alkaline shock family protein YloU